MPASDFSCRFRVFREMKVEESIEPPHEIARVQELMEIRKDLPEAVKERAQELDIPLDQPADAPGSGHER